MSCVLFGGPYIDLLKHVKRFVCFVFFLTVDVFDIGLNRSSHGIKGCLSLPLYRSFDINKKNPSTASELLKSFHE